MVEQIRWRWVLIPALCVALFSACSGADSERKGEYLLRVGEHVLTVQDFHDAFEIAKVPYPHNALQDPEVVKEIRWRLLTQLSEEMVLTERAKVLNLSISDAELQKAVNAAKADYPEGLFEQTLLASAITFTNWVNRLRVRLLIEKVADRDLSQKVDIAPGDVLDYFGAKTRDDELSVGDRMASVDPASVKHMRRIKAEKEYHQWMKSLKQVHRIEINQSLWQEIAQE
jgi:hypothetical protein